MPGGPPRVRLARAARPQKAPASSLATVSEDEDEYNANYCGSAEGKYAHELDSGQVGAGGSLAVIVVRAGFHVRRWYGRVLRRAIGFLTGASDC